MRFQRLCEEIDKLECALIVGDVDVNMLSTFMNL